MLPITNWYPSGAGLCNSTRTECTARSARILNNYLLAKEFAHPLRNDACRNITGTSGSERNNQGQRSGWPALRDCGFLKGKSSNRRHGKNRDNPVHQLSLKRVNIANMISPIRVA